MIQSEKMSANDVFIFTSKGKKIPAVVIDKLETSKFEYSIEFKRWENKYLCYSQNRLFYYIQQVRVDSIIDDNYHYEDDNVNWHYVYLYHSHEVKTVKTFQKILADYVVIPKYDKILKRYEKQR